MPTCCSERYGRRVNLYRDDQGELLPLDRLLDGQPLGTHLYVCGPAPMIDWVRGTAADAGWPAETVHFEHFSAPQPGAPFDVTLAAVGQDDPCRRAGEPARGDRGGRRRPALSLPRRRLRPVRDQCRVQRRHVPAQRPLAVGRRPQLRAQDHALRVALRRAVAGPGTVRDHAPWASTSAPRRFRDDFTFRNSPEHIRRFPFPFHEDSYMYAVNIEPHVPGADGQRARTT